MVTRRMNKRGYGSNKVKKMNDSYPSPMKRGKKSSMKGMKSMKKSRKY